LIMQEQRYCKRLIEVDLPIKKISEHARREKSIRHGHISTLHIWWARRPLAACRAVICAALWPDPADPLCPPRFNEKVAGFMQEFRNQRGGKPRDWRNSLELRKALLDFIAEFADWDNSNSQDFLTLSRKITNLSAQLTVEGNARPLVLDPFGGGGAIALESLRVGADAYSSDINPIAVLLQKVLIEYLPNTDSSLLEDLKRCADKIKEFAWRDLAQLYPKNEARMPLAYFWAKTVRCEGPGCGALVPLLGTLCLSQKKNKVVAYKLIPDPRLKTIGIEIVKNPQSIADGTVKRSNVICPLCNYVTARENVEKQIVQRRGGSKDAQLLCVLWQNPVTQEREFTLPRAEDIAAYEQAKKVLAKKIKESQGDLKFIPDEPLPYLRSIFNVHIYGVKEWGDLFSDRQALLLGTIGAHIKSLLSSDSMDCAEKNKETVALLLTCIFGRMIDQQTTLVAWASTINAVTHTFGRQALGMVWDYVEPNLFADAGGSWDGALDWVSRVVEHVQKAKLEKGTVEIVSATEHILPDDSVDALVTDPPYYDAVPYADLSDFFYVWHKRVLGDRFPSLFASNLTPKKGEAVQLAERNKEYAYKTKEYYEALMTKAFAEGRRMVKPSGIATVVFAHKSTDGWETLLSSLINSGWKITASWPIDTERPVRLRSINAAALASSIHLVCRPREDRKGDLITNYVGDWRDVLQELPVRIHDWMPRLAQEGVVGADAIFACLGPALEVFSKYSRVEKANGEKVELREYLEQVWGAVAKEALNMIFQGAHTEGFEEDARITAMWFWTLSTDSGGNDNVDIDSADDTDDEDVGIIKTTGFSLEYDAARKIAQGLGAHLENLSSIIEIKGDQARLLPVADRVNFLFGKGSTAITSVRKKKKENQMALFEEFNKVDEQSWSLSNEKSAVGKTILDRLHQAMILFGAGRGDAVRRFLVEEGIGKDERFWRLAQALSALYPSNTDEKRWVDGVLARKKSLGF